MSWSNLTDWWLSEVESDSAYEEVVTPLLLEMLQPESGRSYLDAGCGEGRVMPKIEETGARVHGIDINSGLARRASSAMVADLLQIPVRDRTYDGLYSVLTLEHIAEHRAFFAEAARVTRIGGVLAVVVNHPSWTAPGSTPVTDSDDEILWRPGDYFSNGTSGIPGGEGTVVFHHRSMAGLLNAAADEGWSLERMVEQPHHEFEDQAGIPRLLGCRWCKA